MSDILNLNKTYKQQPLLFGDNLGIYDSIHINQDVFNLHKRAVAQLWQADEFSFSSCQSEFAEDNDGTSLMLETLKWQWTADSAACNLYTLLQPFITNDALTQLILFNTYIETVHSETYSEIVKNGFKNPVQVINSISSDNKVIIRLSKTLDAFTELRDLGVKYSQNLLKKEDCYKGVYKGVVALYLMERIQFIASFAVTFALGEMGRFQPPAMAIRKICADELGIHAETDLIMLKDLRKDPLWLDTNTDNFKAELMDMVNEVVARELTWTDHLFTARSLAGINANLIKEWVLFNAQIVKTELGLEHDNKYKTNPLPFMKGWLTMNALQAAPQEQELGQYLVGSITNDLESLQNIDLDF